MTTAYRWSVALALLMAAQSLIGLLFSDQYRDADWIRAAWYANDWVTIALAVPLLVIGVNRAATGSARGVLVWLGAVAYAVYNYAYYLFGAALNASFLLYVAALVVSAVVLIVALSRLAPAEIAGSFSTATPVRVVGGYLVFTGIGLSAAWIAMWGAHIVAGRPTPVPTEAFKLVAALDLTLMVPPLTVGGVLLWRRHPWGYVLAALAGMQAALYLLVLSAGSFMAVRRNLVAPPGEVPIWATLAAITTIANALLIGNIRDDGDSGHRHARARELH